MPNLGLLAEVRIAQYDAERTLFPTSAAVYLEKAEEVVRRGLGLDRANEYLKEAERKIESRRSKGT